MLLCIHAIFSAQNVLSPFSAIGMPLPFFLARKTPSLPLKFSSYVKVIQLTLFIYGALCKLSVFIKCSVSPGRLGRDRSPLPQFLMHLVTALATVYQNVSVQPHGLPVMYVSCLHFMPNPVPTTQQVLNSQKVLNSQEVLDKQQWRKKREKGRRHCSQDMLGFGSVINNPQ